MLLIYPWEQNMMSFLPVYGSAIVFSILLKPPAQSPKAPDVARVEQTSARAIAWLSAAQASGVPIDHFRKYSDRVSFHASKQLKILQPLYDV